MKRLWQHCHAATLKGGKYSIVEDAALVTDGPLIRLPIPELNEQRRKELAKVAAGYAESCKVAIRNVRRDGMDQIKKAKAAGMSEDDQKMWSEEVQDLTDKHIAMVDKALETKQQEIMQV